MSGSFITALSGLRGASAAIDAIGNNLANLNTVGFKGSSVSFQDVVADVSGSSTHQIGSGVSSPQALKQFGQGSIQTTGGRQDAAIQGDGFFIVRKAIDGSPVASATDPTADFYTRAGNFRVDKDGILVTATGERVQGWSLNTITGQLNPSDPTGDIIVPVGTNRAAKATTAFNMNLNLDASASVGSTFAVPVNVYDSLGNAHVISATFTKAVTVNTWNATISSGDPAITAIAPAGPWVFTFNPNGGLLSVAGAGYSATTGLIAGIGLTLGNGSTSPQSVDWAPWQAIPAGAFLGVGRLSQFAQPSASSSIAQDGLPAAQLVSVSIGDGGAVLAQYSNGSEQEVARLSLASIRNPDSLVSIGNNNFRTGVSTANPVIGLAATGGRGALIGGALESSNVDIANEFTKLIIYQRAYSANARVITTTDEISQETINLKH